MVKKVHPRSPIKPGASLPSNTINWSKPRASHPRRHLKGPELMVLWVCDSVSYS